jgi:Cft2 family RNA processing exonuclease
MKIQFLGATRQVTGSRYFLEAGGLRLMIDCGMFQERDFLARNWEPSPVAQDSIDYLLLTHAHLDHSGLLPRFVNSGFQNPILTTAASKDLTEIVLRDAGTDSRGRRGFQEETACARKAQGAASRQAALHARGRRAGPATRSAPWCMTSQ